MKKLLFVLPIALLLVACLDNLKPTFEGVENIAIQQLTFKNVVVNADAVIHNPNPVGITLAKTDLDISVEGIKVGDVVQNNGVEIPKDSDFNLPLTISFKPKDILLTDGGKGLLQMGLDMFENKEVNMLVEGTLTFKVADQDVSIPIKTTEQFLLEK